MCSKLKILKFVPMLCFFRQIQNVLFWKLALSSSELLFFLKCFIFTVSEFLSWLTNLLLLQSPSGRNRANMQKHSWCMFPICQPAVWVTPKWNSAPAPMQSPSTISWDFASFSSCAFMCIHMHTHIIHTHICADYVCICVCSYTWIVPVNDLKWPIQSLNSGF